jgi:serine/threonine-protein kinase
LPKGRSWATEDQALTEIGKMVGDEFSKNFFLQHFNFRAQPINLIITGLPDGGSARLLLRELRGIRQVLDAQLVSESGRFRVQLPEGSAMDIIQDAVLKPLNAKLGQNCFTPAGVAGGDVNVNFSGACADASVLARLETVPPAGLLNAPESRGKALLKAAPKNLT